ncbi:MAG: MarR family transcriptional regulator [Kurthia sp.]|nr:MarR family transcriptional regulator [Candidatus Kurthia equi]
MTDEQDFFGEYRLMYRPFINQINVKLEHHGLFSSQWGLLRLLIDRGPLTFGEIANALFIEKPSATKLIQKLMELDFIEIHAGKDKREKVVHLTANGEKLVGEIHNELNPILEKSLAGVSQQDMEIAKQVLAQIRKNIIGG